MRRAFLKKAECILILAKACQNGASGVHFWGFRQQIPRKL
jgi:hypothetical protein